MKEYKIQQIPTDSKFESLVKSLGSRPAALAYWYKGIYSEKELNELVNAIKLLPVDELHDLESFYNALKPHIDNKSKIAIYGDYDADGALAASIFWRFFSKVLGASATIYIPDRHEEGYGLNKEALLNLAKQGFSLVISVDCGVRDAELIKGVMEETDLEILITDHHQPGDDFPDVPTAHPLHPEKESKNKFTSGAVVAWKVVRYLEGKMDLGTAFSESVVDIAGVSLVTDMMPIRGENKLILRKAIEKLKKDPIFGLGAIMDHAQIKKESLSSYHIGYMIGPRLNASGRIGDQYASARLLCSDKRDYVFNLAQKIHEVNVKRQDGTKEMLQEAEKSKQVLENKFMIATGNNWDDGIIGLVAGRLMNKYDLPTLAITINEDKKEAKGSARSFGEFNITEFLGKLSKHLDRYGGHHNAAGFTLKSSELDSFIKSAEKLLKKEYSEFKPVSEKDVVAELSAEDLADNFFEKISNLEPFGQENEKPIFAVAGKIIQFRTIGATGTHVKYEIETETGNMEVLHFGGVESMRGMSQGDQVIFYGNAQQGEFRGQKQVTFLAEFEEKVK